MQQKQEQYDVGVIMGRFQVHELHDAHVELIEHVCAEHQKVVIVLGVAPLPVSTSNPLDFEARKQMILGQFPNVTVLYHKDRSSDKTWSKSLDVLVGDMLTPGQSAVLYGGRDSFISHYQGRYPTRELVQTVHMAATAIRRDIGRRSTKATRDFRAGVIWASQARFPTAYCTVDVGIFNEDATQLLLGRKPGEHAYRLIGGFSDPGSMTLEDDVKRETREETGVEIGDITYRGSTVVNDWRYRNEPDCIKTVLFRAKYIFGRPTPGDDIEECRWFDWDIKRYLGGIAEEDVVHPHRKLLELLRCKEATR